MYKHAEIQNFIKTKTKIIFQHIRNVNRHKNMIL